MARVRAPVVGVVGAVPVRGGGHLVGGGAARRGVGEVDACEIKKAKIIYGKCTVGKGGKNLHFSPFVSEPFFDRMDGWVVVVR